MASAYLHILPGWEETLEYEYSDIQKSTLKIIGFKKGLL